MRELFNIPALEIRKAFRLIEPELRVGHEKTLELFKKRDLQLFLFKLFESAGLFGNLDIQGAWTLSLFPSTMGGQFYTLNIGPHEVAFAPILKGSEVHDHHLVVDRLIRDYPEAIKWIHHNDGTIEVAPYATARDRAVTIQFRSNFPDAERFFAIPGVRRALVAYWSEGLAEMREQNTSSAFARYHNYDAVYALLEHSRARQNVTIQT